MNSMKAKRYQIVSAFDTETTNVDNETAFVVCYQVNDLRHTHIKDYVPGNGNVSIFRTEKQMTEYLYDIIMWGIPMGIVPIVCAYNAPFDTVTLMAWLGTRYTVRPLAKGRNSVYVYDVYDKHNTHVLRIWDTCYLEQRGLKYMGEACGLPKDDGWDYTLTRTPDTTLTEREVYYAKRDTEVIPMYLRWLLDTNEWMTEEMLGTSILTATSIVRAMAKEKYYKLEVPSGAKRKKTVGQQYIALCNRERSTTYGQYALRHACFRGGLAFTSANYASQVVENVASLDVTSMYHAFINGRSIPDHFREGTQDELQKISEQIVNTPLSSVLDNYNHPFATAVHERVIITNIRLRDNTPFSAYGIGILAESKFARHVSYDDSPFNTNLPNALNITAEEDIKNSGYLDIAHGACFAYGKLMSAREALICVNEMELWNVSQVYTWDEMRVLDGELSFSAVRPPDYVCLQSCQLFEQKQRVKYLINHYEEGVGCSEDLSVLPPSMRASVRDGKISDDDFETYYKKCVKGPFNSIYGTQAQNEYKPSYKIYDGQIVIDDKTRVTDDTFNSKKKSHVLYTYGMRIAGGSRTHLIIAMMLIYNALGDKAIITGGDTDSLKIACDTSVTDAMLLDALRPLHDATRDAISRTQVRVRNNFPNLASSLDGVGEFVVEWCNKSKTSKRYKLHMEAWNKARISLDTDNVVHITCAGISQPSGTYTLSDWMTDMIKDNPEELFRTYAPIVLGYNKTLSPNLSHLLGTTTPTFDDMFDDDVTDYTGKVSHVRAHEAYCLYPISKTIGDTNVYDNTQNLVWLYKHGITTNTTPMTLDVVDGKPTLTITDNTWVNGLW